MVRFACASCTLISLMLGFVSLTAQAKDRHVSGASSGEQNAENARVGLQYRVFTVGPEGCASAQSVRFTDPGSDVVISLPAITTPLLQSGRGAAGSVSPEYCLSEESSMLSTVSAVSGTSCPVPGMVLPSSTQQTFAYVVPPVLQEAGIRQPHKGFRGLLGKLFEPIIGPITSGLDETTYGLHGTAASIFSLQNPLNNLAIPLQQLAQPMSGLASPLVGLGQPITALQQPINELRQPISQLGLPITGLQRPVAELGRSAASLSGPMRGLTVSMGELRQPLSGISEPLLGIRQPLQQLPGPLHDLVRPINGLEAPLKGLQGPLTGVAGSLNSLMTEMHNLRQQIETLHQALLDIGRNVTLAIVFGCSVIAYAIWTQRRIPDVSEPTIITTGPVSRLPPGSEPPSPEAPPPTGSPPPTEK